MWCFMIINISEFEISSCCEELIHHLNWMYVIMTCCIQPSQTRRYVESLRAKSIYTAYLIFNLVKQEDMWNS